MLLWPRRARGGRTRTQTKTRHMLCGRSLKTKPGRIDPTRCTVRARRVRRAQPRQASHGGKRQANRILKAPQGNTVPWASLWQRARWRSERRGELKQEARQEASPLDIHVMPRWSASLASAKQVRPWKCELLSQNGDGFSEREWSESAAQNTGACPPSAVGWGFCSVTADLNCAQEQRTSHARQRHCASGWAPCSHLFGRKVCWTHPYPLRLQVCVLWQGQDRTAHGARCARHTLVQIAASSVETPRCCGDLLVQSPHNFGQFPSVHCDTRDLGGNAVADALAEKGASVFLAANDWVKMDQIAWAAQQRIYATSILAAQAAPRSVSAHPEDVLLATRRIRKRERTILENASTHSLVPVGKGYRCRVCENSTPARGALDWLRSTMCSGPPSSHPSDPVRVGHQMLHESHRLRFHRGVYWCTSCGQLAQHAAGKKSRAIGLVNECPGYQTRAGRDVLAHIERELSPKASADWLMRDSVSVNTDSTPNLIRVRVELKWLRCVFPCCLFTHAWWLLVEGSDASQCDHRVYGSILVKDAMMKDDLSLCLICTRALVYFPVPVNDAEKGWTIQLALLPPLYTSVFFFLHCLQHCWTSDLNCVEHQHDHALCMIAVGVAVGGLSGLEWRSRWSLVISHGHVVPQWLLLANCATSTSWTWSASGESVHDVVSVAAFCLRIWSGAWVQLILLITTVRDRRVKHAHPHLPPDIWFFLLLVARRCGVRPRLGLAYRPTDLVVALARRSLHCTYCLLWSWLEPFSCTWSKMRVIRAKGLEVHRFTVRSPFVA